MLISTSVSAGVRSGTESGGGGGGFVHDQFIFAGYRVLYFLKEYPRGHQLTQKLNLNLCRLRHTLQEEHVYVNRDENGMTDSRGSQVNAFTYRWLINLGENEWTKRFQAKDDLYHLVFKEMLRSEGSRFSSALVDSNDLLPFPKELFLTHSVDVTALKQQDNSCLNENDLLIMKEVRNSHQLFLERELPGCVDTEIKSDERSIDRLLSIARRSKCEIKTSPCGVDTEKLDVGNSFVFVKSIYWRNQKLLDVPFSVIEKATGEQFNFGSEYVRKVLETHLAELEYYKICTPTGRKWTPQIPKIGKLVDNYSSTDPLVLMQAAFMKSFELLRKKPGDMTNASLVGMGSQIELVGEEVKASSGGAAFIKVRILDNTLTHIDAKSGTLFFNNDLLPFRPARPMNFEIAKPGQEGYVVLSTTEWLKYLNPVTGQLLDK